MGVIVVVVIVLIILAVIFSNKGSKNKKGNDQSPSQGLDQRAMMDIVQKVGKNGHGNYWQNFKTRKPQEANAIETICGHNMDTLSDADAFQIVSTFLRWSKNSKTPITELKENFKKQMKALLANGATFDMLIDRLKIEKPKEAKQFNISEHFTITNYMYEWLIEIENEQNKDFITEKIAKNLNIPADKVDDFKKEINKAEEEQHLAPDISKLDREENKLFALANKGVNHLTEFSLLLDENKNYRLNENGKFEARIMCSTMVINLHSHFKNEIDMDEEVDRYFLLLVDSITGDYLDDEIDFINSRITFYKDSIKKIKENPYSKETELILSKIFYLLYRNPLSITFENDFQNDSETSEAKLDFRIVLEDVIKEMEVGRLIITSPSASKLKATFLSLLTNMVPESKREVVNQDLAALFADQASSMIKSGQIDGQLASVLPSNVIQLIKDCYSIINDNNELTEEQIDDVLSNVKDEYIKTFKN
jgi:hypothetical protein